MEEGTFLTTMTSRQHKSPLCINHSSHIALFYISYTCIIFFIYLLLRSSISRFASVMLSYVSLFLPSYFMCPLSLTVSLVIMSYNKDIINMSIT